MIPVQWVVFFFCPLISTFYHHLSWIQIVTYYSLPLIKIFWQNSCSTPRPIILPNDSISLKLSARCGDGMETTSCALIWSVVVHFHIQLFLCISRTDKNNDNLTFQFLCIIKYHTYPYIIFDPILFPYFWCPCSNQNYLNSIVISIYTHESSIVSCTCMML